MASDKRDDDIVRLATADTPALAHIWQQALGEEGIESHVVGDYLDAGFGDIPGMKAELWVHRDDVEKAIEVLRRHPGAINDGSAGRRLLPPRAGLVDLLEDVLALAAVLGRGQLALELQHLLAAAAPPVQLDRAFHHEDFSWTVRPDGKPVSPGGTILPTDRHADNGDR